MSVDNINCYKGEYDIKNDEVKVFIGDEEILLVPFVKKIIKNSSLSIIKELDGYEEKKEIKILIKNNTPD
jgi:hypothetical protein